MPNIRVDDIVTVKPVVGLPNHPLAAFLKKPRVYHSIFWLLYFGLFTLVIVYGVYQVRDVIFYIQLVPIFLLDIALIYFNFYTLMPRLLARRKYIHYAASLSLAIVCTACLNVLLRQIYAYYGSLFFAPTANFGFTSVVTALSERFYGVALTTGIKITKDWLLNQQRMQEKEKQLLEAELNFLKSQIQPHFFFNTLNNLYSLTLKKSDEAPEVVLKLSDLMSYMLYETSLPKAPLYKEIACLQNYIDLEKLRFGKNISVPFIIEGKTDGIHLPPLVLILFVENSFKHGLRSGLNIMEIEILLTVENGWLFFSVKNLAAEDAVAKKQPGIGLKNARRRLQLLYGNNYSLEAGKKENSYVVSLKIPV